MSQLTDCALIVALIINQDAVNSLVLIMAEQEVVETSKKKKKKEKVTPNHNSIILISTSGPHSLHNTLRN